MTAPPSISSSPSSPSAGAGALVVRDNALAPAMPEAAVAVAAELVDEAVEENPILADVGRREQLLIASWLTAQRSARTRRAYAGDLVGWIGWLEHRGVDVLTAQRVHVDLFTQHQLAGKNGAAAGPSEGAAGKPAAPASMARRLSAISSFYTYCALHDLVTGNPVTGVKRPTVDPDYTATVGLSRDEARAVVAAADADTGPERLRTRVVIRLLLHNGLRVDELAAIDEDDLGHDRGHRIARLVRKGGVAAVHVLAPATVDAIDTYRADKATRAGVDVDQLTGPLLVTARGRRLTQTALWRLVRRLALDAGVPSWRDLSVHSFRHTAITLALDAGVPLRDVQDFAGHKSPRTTRRYDHSRASLDRHAAYAVAAYLA